MGDVVGLRARRRPLPPALPRAPVVLMYHGFTEQDRTDDPENLFVALEEFESQLDHLLEHGWEPLDLDGFLAGLDGGGKGRRFLVTIDDGFESVARLAVPALRARSVPAVLFVPAGLVGGTAEWLPEPRGERLLDADQLRDLAQEGLVEVAGHACEHVDMRGLDTAQLERQTAQARAVLQELTGSAIRAFAYPFGRHDSNARDAVARAGYEVSFSVFEDDGRFAVSRVDVNATDTVSSFRLKLVPGYRTWWRVLGRASYVRRLVRRQLTRRARPASSPEAR